MIRFLLVLVAVLFLVDCGEVVSRVDCDWDSNDEGCEV